MGYFHFTESLAHDEVLARESNPVCVRLSFLFSWGFSPNSYEVLGRVMGFNDIRRTEESAGVTPLQGAVLFEPGCFAVSRLAGRVGFHFITRKLAAASPATIS